MMIPFLYSQVAFYRHLDRNQRDLYMKIKKLNERARWELRKFENYTLSRKHIDEEDRAPLLN